MLKRPTNLCGERLDGLEVEVVVQMQVVEVLSVDQQIEHVVALSADLQPHLHPVQLGGLEELGGLEGTEQVPGGKEHSNTRWLETCREHGCRTSAGGSEAHLFFWALGGLCLRALRT